MLPVSHELRKSRDLRRAPVGAMPLEVQLHRLGEEQMKVLSPTVHTTQVGAGLDPPWAGTVNVATSFK